MLAGVAVWQLSSYRSPTRDDGSPRLDPVLVAAPALLMLAGAVLALRLLPLITLVGERLAARGSFARRARSPRGRWADAPSRAAGAVLLLTLAARGRVVLAVVPRAPGARRRPTRSTSRSAPTCGWTACRCPPPEQADVVASLDDVEAASAVASRQVGVGQQASTTVEGRSRTATLLALDTTQAADLLRGRIAPSWETITAPLPPTTPTDAIVLPGAPSSLVMDVETAASTRRCRGACA